MSDIEIVYKLKCSTKMRQAAAIALIRAGVNYMDKGYYLLQDVIVTYLEKDNPVGVKLQDVISHLAGKYGMDFTTVYNSIRTPVENATQPSTIPLRTFIEQVVNEAKIYYACLANREPIADFL